MTTPAIRDCSPLKPSESPLARKIPPTDRTNKESSEGCQRADSLVGEELDRIERFGKHLLSTREMAELAIQDWFDLDARQS